MRILIIVLLSSIYLVGCQPKNEVPSERPNILWLSVEDISPYLAAYGDSTAQTPVLDELAGESLIFTNAYATVPVCAPSRSSLITGMYPVSIGAHQMRTAFDVASWGHRTYKENGDAVDINGDSIRQYAVVPPPEVKCFTEYLRAAGYFCTNNAKTDYQFAAPVTAWDENGNEAHWTNRPDEAPFFAVFNHNVTHESRMWMNADKPLTVDPNKVPLPAFFPDTETVRQDVARNYSNIELMDQQIGEKLKLLQDSGLLENTIIFFFSDHGGPLPRGKREPYMTGLRVPLMVRFPQKMNLTGHVDELVSFVDFAPTVLSLAGIRPPDHLQGQAFLGDYKSVKPRKYAFGSADRFDEFSDMTRAVSDGKFLYVKNFYPERPYYKDVAYRKQINMMNELLAINEAEKLDSISARWFNQTKMPEELYLIEADPLNVESVIEDSKYNKKLDELRGALSNWQEEIGDKGLIPEREMIEQMWPGFVQPKTIKPVIDLTGEGFVARSKTEGVSLAYILSSTPIEPDLDSGWQLYSNQIRPGDKDQFLYVMATRLGYQDSEVVTVHLGSK